MIGKYTGKVPVTLNLTAAAEMGTAASFSGRFDAETLTRNLRRVRALVRIARRHSVALGLSMASVTALSALAATTAVHLSQTRKADITVLPAPPVPQASANVQHHHKFLANPLRGVASWYGSMWKGRRTASGEIFDDAKLTACHKTLPFGTVVRVTDMRTSRSVLVKINDRGTLVPGRIIDLSSAAAQQLGILENGLAHVRLEVVGRAPIHAAPVEIAQVEPRATAEAQ